MYSKNSMGKTPAEVLGHETEIFLKDRDRFVNWERRKPLVCFFQASSLLNSNQLPQFKDISKHLAMIRVLGMEEIIRDISLHL